MKLLLFLLVFGIFLQRTTGWWWGKHRKPSRCHSVDTSSWSACYLHKCRETQQRTLTAKCNKAQPGSKKCQDICRVRNQETRQCYPTNCQPWDFCCPKKCEKPIPNCQQMKCNAAQLPECGTCRGYSRRGAEFSLFWPNGKKSCIPTCSEESHSCWPGTCGEDFLAKSCRCNKGFKLKKSAGVTKCELEKKPQLFTCIMGAGNKRGDLANSTSIKCNEEDDVFINFQPENIYFKTEAMFTWNLNFSKPSYVNDFRLGIVGGEISVQQVNTSGYIKKFKTIHLTETNICSKPINETSPLTQKVLCAKSLELPKYKINQDDKLCVTFTVLAGGYLTLNRIGSNYKPKKFYRKTNNSITKCFHYDILPPKHCIETRNCSQEPVQVKPRITKFDSIEVSFDGWSDSLALENKTKSKSRIALYELTMHEVTQMGKVLQVNLLKSLSTFSTTNQTKVHLKLPRSPALFAFYLSVKDLAGNTHSARGFVLYDNSSKIEMNKKNRPRVLIATGEEDRTPWYSSNKDICITWNKYFQNSFLQDKLQSIQEDPHIAEQYDQSSGILNIHGTWNVDGISEFRYHWQLNEFNQSALFMHAQNKNQSFCIRQDFQDNDRITIWITAIDLLGNNATENITVFIDRSPPVIEDIGLIKGGHENVYIHNSRDLSKMVLKFKALDKESGLKRVKWMLGSTKGGHDIGMGSLPVVILSEKETCPEEFWCYCLTATGICQMNNYSLSLNSLTTKGTNMGQHNRRYYFVFYTENNAGLKSEEHFEIMVDESPPEVGIVLEGPSTKPDMDFTGDDSIIVHWDGFIDHESGISHYTVAIADKCIGKELQNGCRQCNLSVPLFSTKKSFTKLFFPSTGKYFTTVVAFNFAMEPSNPICSDGIVFDKTPPRIVDISLSGARTWEDIACHEGKEWRINSDLTKTQVNNRTGCAVQCDSLATEKLIDLLKEIQFDETVNEKPCPRKRDGLEQRIIGIPSDTIHLTWNYEESETDLLDFYVGIGSDISCKQQPDVIDYTSTNQKAEFRKHHLGIDAGVNFYIFISAVNRAMISQTVTFGPIIIDQSPPLYDGNINVSVSQDTLTLLWHNNTFYDPQQKPLFIFYYHIKNIITNEFVTSLQRYNGQTLHENGLVSINLPLQLRNNKQPPSIIFACELHVFNMVGLFTTVMSPKFQIPVEEPFDHGQVIDIDPMQLSTNDIDFHNRSNTACIRLEGFRHDVQIQVGIGTTSHSANVVNYQSIINRSRHCIQDKAIESFRTYYAVLRISFQGKSSIVASNGFAIINTNITDLIKVYIGECNMSRTIAVKINHQNNNTLYTLDLMEDIDIGQEYSVILDTGHQHAELNGNGLKVLGRRSFITSLKTYLTFMALSKRPLLRIHLKTPVRKLSLALSRCSLSQHFQKSTSKLSAFWTVSDRYVNYVTHFQTGVIDQTCVSNSGQVCTVQDFKNIGRVFNFTQRHLNLISGHTYSFSIRACMMAVGCTERVFSPGTIVLNKAPNIGQLNAKLSKIDHQSFIVIQWTGFSCISGSHVTNPVAYELTVMDSTGSKLVAPQTISNGTSKTEFTYQYKMTSLPRSIVNVSLVTFCLSGLSTKVTTMADAVLQRKHGTDNDVCIYEYDANKHVADQQNWAKDSNPSQRFCGLNDVDSIASSTGRIGAGVIGKNIETENWYLMSVAQTPEYDCPDDQNCLRSAINQVGSNLVQFDIKGLTEEKIYFICARGMKYRISGEQQHFNVCGNGFLIDGTLPEKGEVTVENAFNGFISDQSLVVSWQGFTDRSTQYFRLFTPKIASYSYFIGTYPKQEDISVSKDVGRRSHVVHENLSIADGQQIFVGVRAYDLSGQSVDAISDGIIVDRSPPSNGSLYSGSLMAHDYYVDTNELTIYWNGFLDEHSGIISHQLGIGNREGQDNVISFQEQHLDFSEIQSKQSLVDGHEYYAILKVTNGAGLVTTAVSDKFRVDSSPPLLGVIMELSPEGLGDINYQRETTSLYASWFNFGDPHTGILLYRVGVGSVPLQDNVIAMASVGNKTGAKWHKDFVPGVKYYVTVEACNRAFLCSKTSSNGIIMDNSPPLAGIVELGMNGQHPGYQAHRSLLNVRWAGFHDPHSGMQNFVYCIGTALGLCDVLSWQSALDETSTVVTGVNLPSNKLLYVTVKGFNNVGLNITASSSGFLIDDTPPIIQSEPRLLNSDNTEVMTKVMTTADCSLLHVHWSFKDDESPIVEQFIRIHPHTSGMISLKNMLLPPLSRTTIQLKEKEWLQDGSTYNISMTVCNAAGLCASTTSRQQILVDSTRPVMGRFLPDKLFWFQKPTVTCLNLTWNGFVDSESGIKRYHLFVRDSKGQFLIQPIIANHSANPNQFMSVNLKRKLSTSEAIILEVMAENGIGLYSKIFKITANLVSSSRVADFGSLDIQRHSCPIQYCNNDCTCASQGKKCEPVVKAKCKQIEKAEHRVKLQVQNVNDVTASARCLSAHWTISDLKQARRIEWSAGINGSAIGTGVFNLQKENPWQDVGIQDHVIYCLPSGQILETGERYVFYLRVWYSFDEYAVFTSENSVQADLTPPIVHRGARIIDAVGSCEDADFDYISKVKTIGACWENVFLDPQSSIDKYIVMAGTAPGMGDLIAPVTIAINKTHLFKEVKLNKGTKYYFTVIALNTLGLFTILNSNGFVFDDEPPTNGIVYNTDSYRNSPHQNIQDSFGISWHGFQDSHSAIKEYQVAMGLAGSDPSEISFVSAGMATSYTFSGLSAKHNDNYVGYVKAVDAAGHTSDIIQSKFVCVDKTPAKSVGCEIFSQILTKQYNENQSKEKNRGRFSNGEFAISINLTFNEFYDLKFIIPSNIKNQNTILLVGNEAINVPFTISGPTSVLQYRFLSRFEGKTNISLKFFACKNYPKTLKFSLSKCTSGKNYSINGINLKQISPTVILVSFNVFDEESGIKQVSIGAGTTLGGFQINQLKKISSSHGPYIIHSSSLPHGQMVYVTLLVENWAGLESVITDQLVIDHTPSKIDIMSLIFHYEKGKGNVIKARWKVVDMESKVEECYYDIGSKSGSKNINDWTISPANYSIQKILKSTEIFNESLYLTVICTNKANLQTKKESKFNISAESKTPTPELKFHIIPTNIWSGVNYSNHVQSDLNQLNVQIDQYGCFEDIHKCRILEDGQSFVDWTEIGHRYHYTFQNLNLKQGKSYQVEIKNVNNEKIISGVTESIIIDSSHPQLTGSPVTIEKLSPSIFKMQWRQVFKPNQFQNTKYFVSIGNAKAMTNIVHKRETWQTSTIFRVNNPGTIYVSLMAVYDTALFTIYSQEVNISPF